MATYSIVPKTVPSSQRSARITAVAALDKIDFTDILGRPARGVKLVTTNVGDIVTYKLNNLLKVQAFNESAAPTEVDIWSSGAGYSSFSATGDTEHIIADELQVASIEIVSLVGVATIEIIIW